MLSTDSLLLMGLILLLMYANIILMYLNTLFFRTAKENHPVTFAIAACETQNVNVTVLPNFGLSGENSVTARDMWASMVQV